MSPVISPQDTLVHSYLFLRRAIGLIGLALPIVLVVGKQFVDGGQLLDSISGYYYSDMRGVFVGSMFAVGVFLLSYRGYEAIDDIAGNIAAVGAFGVALFPTTPSGKATHTQQIIGIVHVVSATVFFLTLALFCLFLFRRDDGTQPTARKFRRNGVYLACGVAIMLCLVLIAVDIQFLNTAIAWLHPVLWLESGAVLAFGFAWLTKGETILRDVSPTLAAVPATV